MAPAGIAIRMLRPAGAPVLHYGIGTAGIESRDEVEKLAVDGVYAVLAMLLRADGRVDCVVASDSPVPGCPSTYVETAPADAGALFVFEPGVPWAMTLLPQAAEWRGVNLIAEVFGQTDARLAETLALADAEDQPAARSLWSWCRDAQERLAAWRRSQIV